VKGVQYFVDQNGKPKSVVIDLEIWGGLWEDIYDSMLSELNESDDPLPWEEVKQRLTQKAEPHADIQPAG